MVITFNLEKCGNLGKTAIFSVRYGYWEYATSVDMAGLGSKGIKYSSLGALSAKLEYLPN